MEIQSKSTPLQSPRPQVATPQPQTASPAPSGAAIATAPIPKAEIKVNVEQMKKNLDQAIGQLNDNMRDGGRNLAFAMDEVLGRPIIVVKKEDTGEVIRQIPNEVVIKVAHNLDKLKGLLFNTRA
jgi:flagellar protein FlaG